MGVNMIEIALRPVNQETANLLIQHADEIQDFLFEATGSAFDIPESEYMNQIGMRIDSPPFIASTAIPFLVIQAFTYTVPNTEGTLQVWRFALARAWVQFLENH